MVRVGLSEPRREQYFQGLADDDGPLRGELEHGPGQAFGLPQGLLGRRLPPVARVARTLVAWV